MCTCTISLIYLHYSFMLLLYLRFHTKAFPSACSKARLLFRTPNKEKNTSSGLFLLALGVCSTFLLVKKMLSPIGTPFRDAFCHTPETTSPQRPLQRLSQKRLQAAAKKKHTSAHSGPSFPAGFALRRRSLTSAHRCTTKSLLKFQRMHLDERVVALQAAQVTLRPRVRGVTRRVRLVVRDYLDAPIGIVPAKEFHSRFHLLDFHVTLSRRVKTGRPCEAHDRPWDGHDSTHHIWHVAQGVHERQVHRLPMASSGHESCPGTNAQEKHHLAVSCRPGAALPNQWTDGVV